MNSIPIVSEWLPFISKSIELVTASVIYIFLIENFLIKSYIPGEIIYAVDPCKEPYVTDPKSKNPYQKINPFISLDQDASARKNSRYDFCNREEDDLINKFGKNNQDLKKFLYEMRSSSRIDISFLYNQFREFNRKRAGKVEYHGIISEAFLLILASYFKSTIDLRQLLKTIHNIFGSFDVKNTFFFTIFFGLLISVYFFMSESVGSDKPWYYFIFTLMSTIFIQIFGFLSLITVGCSCIFGLIFLFYILTTMPITFICTGIAPALAIAFGLTMLQGLILFIQFFNYYIPLNSYFRTVTMCDVNNYKTPIIIILTLFTILNAILLLNSSNMIIFLSTLFIFLIYNYFISPSSETTMSETCKTSMDMLDKIKEINDAYLNNNINNNQ